MAKSTSSRRNQITNKSRPVKSSRTGSSISGRKIPQKPRSKRADDSNSSKGSWDEIFTDIKIVLGISTGAVNTKKPDRKASKTSPPAIEEITVKPIPKSLKNPKTKEVKLTPGLVSSILALLRVGKTLKQNNQVKKRDLPVKHEKKSDFVSDGLLQKKRSIFSRIWKLITYRPSKRWILIFFTAVIFLALAVRFRSDLWQLKEDLLAPYPPSPNVVATFNGGQITIEDVQKHVSTLTKDEEMQKELKTPEGYRYVVSEMISDEVIRQYAKEKKTDQKKEITHVMQHITEEINISALHTEMHEGQMGVNESDIQAYYDANRKDFGEQTLTQARDQILNTLQSQKEDTFVKNYIDGLKNKASISRDDSILPVPEPQDFEVRNYFDTNRDKYQGKQFEEVAEQVKNDVRTEKEKTYYQDNASRTLFTVNGKQYTLGQFGEEYGELPQTFLVDYQGTEGKQKLVDRIIERLLLYEDSLTQVSQTETKEKKDEVQLKVMGQMLEQEEVDEKINITDEEIKQFYEENKAEMVEPPQSKIRHIMIMLGSTDDEKKKAREKAEMAYKKLVPGPFQKGADFAEVAKEFSEDPATAPNGGEMPDWIGGEADFMNEKKDHTMDEQAMTLQKGEVSKPFESGGMIHIIQVTERGEPKQLSLEETKEHIRELLSDEKHRELAGQLSEQLRKKVNATIYERTLKKLANNQNN